MPEVDSVQTHLAEAKPLSEAGEGTEAAARSADAARIAAIVRDASGADPREPRFLNTGEGLVAFLTLGLDPSLTLADAHGRERGRGEDPRRPARHRRRDRPHRAVKVRELAR